MRGGACFHGTGRAPPLLLEIARVSCPLLLLSEGGPRGARCGGALLWRRRGAAIADGERVTVEQAEIAEREAFAAIGRLGLIELENVRCFVASGCEGPRPRPDDEARRVLTDNLTAAIAAREAAARAAGGQDGAAGLDAPAKVEIAATVRRCGAVRAA